MGHSISPDWKKSKIIVKDQEFEIKFIEKSNRITISENRWNSTRLVPNGKLSIKSRISWNDKEWKDGYELLEEQLPKIVAYYEVKADDEIKRKIQREIEQKEEERFRKIEEEKRARLQWEEDKKDIIMKDAQKWTELTNLRNFISATKSMRMNTESDDVDNWITWAETVLRDRDFLQSGIESYIRKYDFNYTNKD